MPAFADLPVELHRAMLTYCDRDSLVACCLVSRQLLESSRPALYYSVTLSTEDRAARFIETALGNISLVYRLHATFHTEPQWIILLDSLIRAERLETLDLIPVGFRHIIHGEKICDAFEKLALIPSLRTVKAQIPDAAGSWRHLSLWGTRLKGLQIGKYSSARLPIPPYTGGEDLPTLHTLQILVLALPWSSFKSHFDIYSLRRLCIKLEEDHGDTYVEILKNSSKSLQTLSLAWMIGGKAPAPTFHGSLENFDSLSSLVLVIPTVPPYYNGSPPLQQFLESIADRASNFKKLKIYFLSYFHPWEQPTLVTTEWRNLATCLCQLPLTTLQLWLSDGENWSNEAKDIIRGELTRSFERFVGNGLTIFWHNDVSWRRFWAYA
ncbi:hypothetical protein DL96DRAFT_1682866 [Flagelloscypha sp. PMI_526]|nr:hypothetical protein DL96DRAFT_1682866 [Flagelloscypha sp. PMI_526]